MEELFKVINLENKDKIGNLVTESHSQVKSIKYFPIYIINGKKMIFKPLSKTKPLLTPFFAFSEVYWSYIIKKYFEPRTPSYFLAICKGIEQEQPKYFERGVLVESITPKDEKLINLYDYFNDYPEPSVDIKDYINYCMTNYDYTKILLSKFIVNNKKIGEELTYQILLSILRQDQNFHYENVNLIYNNKNFLLMPPIDFEYSTPFLYPDKQEKYQYVKAKYNNELNIKYEEDEILNILRQIKLEKGLQLNSTLTNNICLIVRLYPDIVLKFIRNLDKVIANISKITINDPDNYIGILNSDYWQVNHAYYKDNDLKKYEDLKAEIKLQLIDKNLAFQRISADILSFSKYFNLLLKIYLISRYNGIEDLENLTIKQLLNELNITGDVTIDDIDINTKKIKLKKYSI